MLREVVGRASGAGVVAVDPAKHVPLQKAKGHLQVIGERE